MGIAYIEAARLAGANRTRHEELRQRCHDLAARVEWERAGQDARRHAVHEHALVPFRDAFTRLKNVELVDVAEFELPATASLPAIATVDVDLPGLGLLGSLVAGLTAGAGAGSATVAGVGTFAAASTGTPIAGLSGAAATNATLAWLGGGSLAAGGGGVAAGSMVLSGVVTVPAALAVVGYGSWKGRKERAEQRASTVQLDGVEATVDAQERWWEPVLAHLAGIRALLADLQTAITDRLPRLVARVGSDDNYATWSFEQRRWLATLVDLVSTAASLMATPPVGDDGVGARSVQVASDARRLLDRLPEHRSDAA